MEAELTLTEESSRALFKLLEEQDKMFMEALFNGECGFTLKCTDGRSVELVPQHRQEGWIPCSERLPERLERVLVTRANGRVEETFKWNSEEYPWNGGYDDVLAWMPLPEPWKGADNE